MEASPPGEAKTTVVIEGQRNGEGSTLPVEMGVPEEIGFTIPKEGLYDDMHFTMRRLFFDTNVSPMSNNLLPISLGSTSPNLPLVLYHNLDQFLYKLIKVINVHIVYATYKTGIISIRNITVVETYKDHCWLEGS